MATASSRTRIIRTPASSRDTLGSTPGRTRTCDRRFRKPLLYPPELRAHRSVTETHAEIAGPATGASRNAPGRIRTCDLRFRKPPLYPPELRARTQGFAILVHRRYAVNRAVLSDCGRSRSLASGGPRMPGLTSGRASRGPRKHSPDSGVRSIDVAETPGQALPHGIRVAVVTGGGRGIGRGIVTELAALGFSVVVNYRSDASAALECCREAEARGARQALPIQADVADLREGRRLLEQTLDRLGRVDLWVNNAGVAPRARPTCWRRRPRAGTRFWPPTCEAPSSSPRPWRPSMLEQKRTGVITIRRSCLHHLGLQHLRQRESPGVLRRQGRAEHGGPALRRQACGRGNPGLRDPPRIDRHRHDPSGSCRLHRADRRGALADPDAGEYPPMSVVPWRPWPRALSLLHRRSDPCRRRAQPPVL